MPLDKYKAKRDFKGLFVAELAQRRIAQQGPISKAAVAQERRTRRHLANRSLIEKSAERYFDERPRQASRVVDGISGSSGRTAALGMSNRNRAGL